MNLRRLIFRSPCRRAALTLLEMMVAVTLLALIMVGMLAMFMQTQKALLAVNAQTDVFENARGAIQMLSRDISEMRSYGETNVANFTFGQSALSGGVSVGLPSGYSADLRFHEAFWLARANDTWSGIGYFVDSQSQGVGTLYRFSTSGRENLVPAFFPAYLASGPFGSSATNVHRVSDGIVNLQFNAVYPEVSNGVTNFVSTNNFIFWNDRLPAYVDVELGVLEPSTLKQMQALLSIPNVAQKDVDSFLTNHVGNIHYFRQRVPIRNFLNPYRLNEVP